MNSTIPFEYYIFCKTTADQMIWELRFSRLFTAIVVIFLGFLVLRNRKKEAGSRSFMLLTISFAVWAFVDYTIWVGFSSERLVAFLWSFFPPLAILIFVSSFYFLYQFLFKEPPHKFLSYCCAVLFLLVGITAQTKLHITGYDSPNCQVFENISYVAAYHGVGLVVIVGIILLYVKSLRQKGRPIEQHKNFLMTAGVLAFLCSFLLSSFFASYFVNIGWLKDYRLEQWGYWGMLAFLLCISYAILRYRFFDIRIVIRKGLITSLVSIFVVGVFVIALFIISQFVQVGLNTITVILLLIASGVVALTVGKLQRVLNHALLKEYYDFSVDMDQLDDSFQFTNALDAITLYVEKKTRKLTNVKDLRFLIRNEQTHAYVSQPPYQGEIVLQPTEPLAVVLQTFNVPCILDEIDFIIEKQQPARKEQLEATRRQMLKLHWDVALPLPGRDGLVGVIGFSRRTTTRAYSRDHIIKLYEYAKKLGKYLQSALDGEAAQDRLEALNFVKKMDRSGEARRLWRELKDDKP